MTSPLDYEAISAEEAGKAIARSLVYRSNEVLMVAGQMIEFRTEAGLIQKQERITLSLGTSIENIINDVKTNTRAGLAARLSKMILSATMKAEEFVAAEDWGRARMAIARATAYAELIQIIELGDAAPLEFPFTDVEEEIEAYGI